uniref:CSON000409 protein n=1 Tax=Culicoides sonorensis TaxID=179676 RepID=A0A336K8G9_CULSO
MSKVDAFGIDKKIRERLNNDQYFDVMFRFPPDQDGDDCKTIGAHKFVLVTASDVFEKMFHGSLSETNKNAEGQIVVEIPDIKFPVFKLFLSAVYGHQIIITDHQLAIELCYVLDKYNCGEISSIVETIMVNLACSDNAIKLYECAKMFNLQNLKTECYLLFSNFTTEILLGEDFFSADPETVIEIFKTDELGIESEKQLVDALQCYIKNKISVDPEIENKVREAVLAIRFLTLEKFDIAHTLLLSDAEKKLFLVYLESKEENKDTNLPNKFSVNRENRCKLKSSKDHYYLKIISNFLTSNYYGACTHYSLLSSLNSYNSCKCSPNMKSDALKNIYNKYRHSIIKDYAECDLETLFKTFEKK